MKRYTSQSTKWLAIATLISVATFVTGIVLIVVNSTSIGLKIGATGFGGLMSILFVSCFLEVWQSMESAL